MVINWEGENYFKIQSGRLTILIDPFNLRSLRGADLVLNTLRPALTRPIEEKKQFWIDHAGEYEFSGVFVKGWPAGFNEAKEKTIYQIEIEEIKLTNFGYINRLNKETEEISREIEKSDIIIAAPALGPLIKSLKPKIFIPSLVSMKELAQKITKEFGSMKISPEEKLVVRKRELAEIKELTIRCLKF